MPVRAFRCMRRLRTIFRIDEKHSGMFVGLIGIPMHDRQVSNFLVPDVTRAMQHQNQISCVTC